MAGTGTTLPFTFNSEFTNVQLQRISFARLHVLTAALRDICVLWCYAVIQYTVPNISDEYSASTLVVKQPMKS